MIIKQKKKWSGNVLGLCIDDDDDYDDSGGRWSDMYLVITRWCVCEWNGMKSMKSTGLKKTCFFSCAMYYMPPLHHHRYTIIIVSLSLDVRNGFDHSKKKKKKENDLNEQKRERILSVVWYVLFILFVVMVDIHT